MPLTTIQADLEPPHPEPHSTRKAKAKATFADRLRALMTAGGDTQVSLAAALNVSQGAVFKHLRGTMPRAETLSRIMQHYGVTWSHLLHGDTTEPALTPAMEGEVDGEMTEAEAEISHDLYQARQHLYFQTNLLELFREERRMHLQELESLRAACGKQTVTQHTPAHEAASGAQGPSSLANSQTAGGVTTPEPDHLPETHPEQGCLLSTPAQSADALDASALSRSTGASHAPTNQSQSAKSSPECAEHTAKAKEL